MKAMELIQFAMQMADQATLALIEDMRNAPLTSPTPRGGNHPLWVLGHLTIVEGMIPQLVLGESNPVEHWKEHFWVGTEPTTRADAYPAFDEVLETYRDLRARNLRLLAEIGEGGLDRLTKSPPPGLEEPLKTVGRAFLVCAMHQMNHRGQVADARRAAGRKPMMTPGDAAAVS